MKTVVLVRVLLVPLAPLQQQQQEEELEEQEGRWKSAEQRPS